MPVATAAQTGSGCVGRMVARSIDAPRVQHAAEVRQPSLRDARQDVLERRAVEEQQRDVRADCRDGGGPSA